MLQNPSPQNPPYMTKIRFVGIAATFVGAGANDGVMDFTGTTTQVLQGTLTAAQSVVVTQNAALGATFKPQLRGKWNVKLEVPNVWAAANSLAIAISLDASAAALGGTISLTDTTIRARSLITAVAADVATAWHSLAVDDIDIPDALLGPGVGLVRAHASTGAGVAPGANQGITVAEVALTFTYLGDTYA